MQSICNRYAKSSKCLPGNHHDVCQDKEVGQAEKRVDAGKHEEVEKLSMAIAKPFPCADQCPSIYLFDYLRGGSYDID